MSLDGALPTLFSFHDDLECYDFARNLQGCFNYTTYNAQSLSYGDHLLDITIFTPSNASLFPYSDYFLDYVAINDTDPNPPAPSNTASLNLIPTQITTNSNPTESAVSASAHRNACARSIGSISHSV